MTHIPFTFRRVCATLGLCGTLLAASTVLGETPMIEDFSGTPDQRWQVFSDQVMGGKSTGQAALEQEAGRTILRLQGDVSTANNGGFLQARLILPERLPPDARGLEVKVRGNGQTYYIHLRTDGTVLPWKFYQAAFPTSADWQVIRLPFATFTAEGRGMRDSLAADAIKSIAVAGYGRDHTADVSVASIGYY